MRRTVLPAGLAIAIPEVEAVAALIHGHTGETRPVAARGSSGAPPAFRSPTQGVPVAWRPRGGQMRLAMAVVVSGLVATQVGAAAEPTLKTKKEKVSYAMAVAMARTIQRQGVDIDLGVFATGMRDVLQGGHLLMTPEEMRQVMSAVLDDAKRKQKRAEAGKGGASQK